MNVLFWDIDQTMIMTGHAGFLAIAHTLAELMGEDAPLPTFDAGGRTDNFICREILRYATGKEPEVHEIQQFSRHYEKVLLACMQETDGYVLPHVKELLAYFSGLPNFDQLLLTGNSYEGAMLKLSYYGLATYFDFSYSAFARQHFNREDVAADALRLAREKWGEDLEKIFIIGDTEHDIRCGKSIGAYTIAVATGTRSYAELAIHQPWRLYTELPPADEFHTMLQEAEK